jgi:hypothetical protein
MSYWRLKMTQVIRTLNVNTAIELGLRFGDLKPIPTGVKVPKGDTWKCYAKDVTRRTVTIRKGKMDTQEFLSLWKICRNHRERVAAFGGLLQEIEDQMIGWGTPFGTVVKYREYVGFRKDRLSLNEYSCRYTWDFDPSEGAWVFQSHVSNAHADKWLREKYDIHRWSARGVDEVLEVEEYLRKRLGID